MKKTEKVQKIISILETRYPRTAPPLDHADTYSLLVAVLLSAQTTDARVNTVTPGLFAMAGTPQAMAKRSESEILHKIKTLGLAKTKARNVKKLSEILTAEHNGTVPASFAELEKLPGVGHKTASVVMAQAFGVPAFPVDTHIHRLAWRWGLSDGSNVNKTERDLKRLTPKEKWNALHLQFIFFGREHCPSRGHAPQTCPICSWAAVKKRLLLEEKHRRGGPIRG